MRISFRWTLLCLLPAVACAQESSDLKKILERLESLERENRSLAAEVHGLREELSVMRTALTPPGAAQAPAACPELDERVAVAERRIEEQAQTKVEASQRFPIRLTGMALFNAFLNEPNYDPGSYRPTYSGGTLRQSRIGLSFNGPEIFGGGKVSGDVNFDFFAGSSDSLNHIARLRTGSLYVDWKDQTFMFGQEKPLISPREPSSFAQVGIPPQAGAGNLWLWLPQARFEQRFHFGEQTGLRAQISLLQTGETYAYVPDEYANSLAPARPAVEARLEFWHRFSSGGRIEFAPGFHTSQTHVAAASVPSRLYSADWFANPWPKIEFSGTFYQGENIANLGALGLGFTFDQNGAVHPVHSVGGWAQLAFLLSSRVTLNVFGGQHDDRTAGASAISLGRNQSYAANVMYRLAPNVIVALEGQHPGNQYFQNTLHPKNQYDLALAYLF